ncbi:chromosome segregation protein SMC [Halostagnicola larsenii XH-48]|uniref:DNA double-strand break repair Rad50 ATPase n=1 Tax=Halostagnicola larsenii XH-48 TaxID=797299 RepID=W0JKT4_9EURY|nr:DNA double-strand break repair ATPase Rad50 [Halostagnicola larsenii]AHF99213.1 chromosome segregation protein SMC [Halostagnicola larsenii XH-48]
MKVERIRLRNFKCYGEADLGLERGVTIVHGVNGSGKSTLLEGVFFALYGSKALDNRTLDDVITTGEEEAEIELAFRHDDVDYRIERRLKLRGDRATTTKCVLETPEGTVEGATDVRQKVTNLLRMDAEAFVNCAYVRQGEVNKLIHASPSDRQDMIDDLLQLGALEEYRERASDARLGVKTVLDGQQDVLEDVRTQVEQKEEKDLHERLNELESRRAELADDIENFESQRENASDTLEASTEILERHEETREEIETLEEEIETIRSKINETERKREDAGETIDDRKTRRDDLEDERETILEEIDHVSESGDDTVDTDGDGDAGDDGLELPEPPQALESTAAVEARIDALERADEQLRDDLETLRVEINERSNETDRLESQAAEFESEAADKRERAGDLESKIDDDEDAIEQREEKLSTLEERIEAARERFDAAPIDFGEATDHRETIAEDREAIVSELGDVTAGIKAVRGSIEEGEALLEEGKCPECGQPVEDSPHVDVLDEKRERLAELEAERDALEDERDEIGERIDRAETLREAEREVDRLADNRDNVAQLLAEKRETLADRRERCEQLREDADELEAEAEQHRDAATDLDAQIDDARSDLGKINGTRGEIRTELEELHRLLEIDDEREEIEREIENARERRADWQTMNDERREQLSAKRDRKRELTDEFDEQRIEQAREQKRSAEDYLEKVDEKLSTLREKRTEIQNAIGGVENELEELERLRERLEAIETRCGDLESLYDEAETLQATYGDLRAELRQRNVETLERLLNETFELVYQNDSYASIDLDGQYRLTVYQKDGEPLEPEQLSGGERALFNLSLRCAIYRLLAEGVEGTAPMPPLILDEPTVFLDSGHVTQLVSLVESMRDLGVEQIIVVSHDEELVGAADELVRVEKDATSNRSQLERGEPPEIALLSSD